MTNDMDKLISGLCSEYKGVRLLNCSFRCAWLTALISGGWVAVLIPFSGIRHDWADVMHDPVFIFENALVLVTWVLALMAASLLRVPDMAGHTWLLRAPLVLLAIMAGWIFYRTAAEGGMRLEINWHHCCSNGIIYGIIPLALLTFVSRSGATTRPYWMAFMNALAVGTAGWVGLRLSCPMDDVGHGFVYHFVPFVLLGSLFLPVARRLFRW
jgi:hypothetical protein